MCVNRLVMLSVTLPVKSKLLVLTFWWSQLYKGFVAALGVGLLTLALCKGQLYQGTVMGRVGSGRTRTSSFKEWIQELPILRQGLNRTSHS